MDWGALYHFLFETYEGFGLSVVACLVICLIAAVVAERSARNRFKSRPKGENDFDLFDGDDQYDEEGRLKDDAQSNQ